MEIFKGWEGYTEKIEKNWKAIISSEDTVVLAGDISWAVGLERARTDFEFLNSLPGKKIIIKGNHDFWWSTASKMNSFLEENKFESLQILHNNSICAGEYAVCGTRGWLYDGTAEQDIKVLRREAGRLEASVSAALDSGLKPTVFLHYPPVYSGYVCKEITEILQRYEIREVWYGHIHGSGRYQTVSEYNGIKLHLVSCDCVGFTPVLIG